MRNMNQKVPRGEKYGPAKNFSWTSAMTFTIRLFRIFKTLGVKINSHSLFSSLILKYM